MSIIFRENADRMSWEDQRKLDQLKNELRELEKEV